MRFGHRFHREVKPCGTRCNRTGITTSLGAHVQIELVTSRCQLNEPTFRCPSNYLPSIIMAQIRRTRRSRRTLAKTDSPTMRSANVAVEKQLRHGSRVELRTPRVPDPTRTDVGTMIVAAPHRRSGPIVRDPTDTRSIYQMDLWYCWRRPRLVTVFVSLRTSLPQFRQLEPVKQGGAPREHRTVQMQTGKARQKSRAARQVS
jgi:hypothetical protein